MTETEPEQHKPPVDLPDFIIRFMGIRENILKASRPDQKRNFSADLQGFLTDLVMAAGLPSEVQDELLRPDNRFAIAATESGIRAALTDPARGHTVIYRIDANPDEKTLGIHVVRHDLNSRSGKFPGDGNNFRTETDVTFTSASITHSRLAETHGTIRYPQPI